jgi:signal transduction histidine kinase
VGGLGLGLAISKAIIASHGGKIYASSKGSRTGATLRRFKTAHSASLSSANGQNGFSRSACSAYRRRGKAALSRSAE